MMLVASYLTVEVKSATLGSSLLVLAEFRDSNPCFTLQSGV